MVTVEAPQLIGVGLYTPREAARFTKLRTGTFNRWFYGDAQGQPALKPRFDSTAEDRVVTFWDLIQALAVRRVRTSPMGKRISLQHIRDVVGECEGMGITSRSLGDIRSIGLVTGLFSARTTRAQAESSTSGYPPAWTKTNCTTAQS